MKSAGRIPFGIIAIVFILSAGAYAWQPSGWVYHNGDYAYSGNECEWYYIERGNTQWWFNLNTGVWSRLYEAADWHYYDWPYVYSYFVDAWFWQVPGDGTWCCRLSSGEWTLIGTQPEAEGMVYVEGGTFTMGDTWGADGNHDELPTHSVMVAGFLMDKYQVTNQKMAEVLNWAEEHGKLAASTSSVSNASGDNQELLDLDSPYCQISWDGSSFVVDLGKGNYPCVEVSWYGAAACCNYRSEKEGLSPCYDLSDWSCDWNANGYRLPTEAEWEYAAKGGWNGSYTKYSGSDNPDSVAWYWENSDVPGNSEFWSDRGTLQVGTKAANELGIHDMAGNVWEWCNDWYDLDYYESSPTSNPRGPPDSNMGRILRGGSWYCIAHYCRVADRSRSHSSHTNFGYGFRCVR